MIPGTLDWCLLRLLPGDSNDKIRGGIVPKLHDRCTIASKIIVTGLSDTYLSAYLTLQIRVSMKIFTSRVFLDLCKSLLLTDYTSSVASRIYRLYLSRISPRNNIPIP